METSNSFTKKERSNISTEEVMIDFLDAISVVYCNSMMLKGCMALYICSNFKTALRKTRDLDFNFFSIDDWEDFCANSASIATKYSKLKFTYNLTGRRGFEKNPNGDSIKFKAVKEGMTIEFKIDMNIGDKILSDLSNDVTENPINLYTIYGILSDKLKVLAEKKLCRRIKDLVDVYYISTIHNVDFEVLVNSINERYGTQLLESLNPCFILNLENYNLLKHAYDKYDLGDIKKYDFDEVYDRVLKFCSPVYEYLVDSEIKYKEWDKEEVLWVR